jgi:general secretion pathway protein J
MRAPRRSRGFTLIEMILAMVVAAMLLAAVVSSLFGAVRLRRTALEAREASLPRHHVEQRLARDLTAAVSPTGLLNGPFLVLSSGSGEDARDVIEFHTTSGVIEESAPWGDIRRVEYFIDEDQPAVGGEGFALVRRETFNLLPSTEDETGRRDTVLLAAARGFSVECHDGTSWLESWDSATVDNANPNAVRLTVYPQSAEAAPIVVVRRILVQPRPTATGAAPAGLGGGGAP